MKDLIVAFYQSKKGKTALWICLNSIMGLLIAFLGFLIAGGSESAEFLLYILTPPATALSQYVTKTLNS